MQARHRNTKQGMLPPNVYKYQRGYVFLVALAVLFAMFWR